MRLEYKIGIVVALVVVTLEPIFFVTRDATQTRHPARHDALASRRPGKTTSPNPCRRRRQAPKGHPVAPRHRAQTIRRSPAPNDPNHLDPDARRAAGISSETPIEPAACTTGSGGRSDHDARPASRAVHGAQLKSPVLHTPPTPLPTVVDSHTTRPVSALRRARRSRPHPQARSRAGRTHNAEERRTLAIGQQIRSEKYTSTFSTPTRNTRIRASSSPASS